jgi:hypothetical protein
MADKGPVALTLALFAAAAFSGCAAPSQDEAGTFALYVKDQPTDEFSQIWIRFTSVEIVGGGQGRTGVWNGTRGVDLRSLNGSDARGFLGETEVTAGNYSQVRLGIAAAWGVREDGGRQNFTVPSQVLRINVAFDVGPNANTTFTADFDLDRSIVRAGQSGNWIMRPVLHRVIIQEGQAQERVDEDPDLE